MLPCASSSLKGNCSSSAKVPLSGNDWWTERLYPWDMAQQPFYDWYLKEWLATLRKPNSWFEIETGWTHRIANQLINRKTRWNRDHLALAASVLHLAPYELLMHPDEAMHVRRLRAAAAEELRLRKVAEEQNDFREQDTAGDRLRPRRAKAG